MKTATQTKVYAKEKAIEKAREASTRTKERATATARAKAREARVRASARAKKSEGFEGKVKVVAMKEKELLIEAVSVLQKSMSVYKKERKADWKIFKKKFKSDMDIIKDSLKKISKNHKKHSQKSEK